MDALGRSRPTLRVHATTGNFPEGLDEAESVERTGSNNIVEGALPSEGPAP